MCNSIQILNLFWALRSWLHRLYIFVLHCVTLAIIMLIIIHMAFNNEIIALVKMSLTRAEWYTLLALRFESTISTLTTFGFKRIRILFRFKVKNLILIFLLPFLLLNFVVGFLFYSSASRQQQERRRREEKKTPKRGHKI